MQSEGIFSPLMISLIFVQDYFSKERIQNSSKILLFSLMPP